MDGLSIADAVANKSPKLQGKSHYLEHLEVHSFLHSVIPLHILKGQLIDRIPSVVMVLDHSVHLSIDSLHEGLFQHPPFLSLDLPVILNLMEALGHVLHHFQIVLNESDLIDWIGLNGLRDALVNGESQ